MGKESASDSILARRLAASRRIPAADAGWFSTPLVSLKTTPVVGVSTFHCGGASNCSTSHEDRATTGCRDCRGIECMVMSGNVVEMRDAVSGGMSLAVHHAVRNNQRGNTTNDESQMPCLMVVILFSLITAQAKCVGDYFVLTETVLLLWDGHGMTSDDRPCPSAESHPCLD